MKPSGLAPRLHHITHLLEVCHRDAVGVAQGTNSNLSSRERGALLGHLSLYGRHAGVRPDQQEDDLAVGAVLCLRERGEERKMEENEKHLRARF